MKSLQTIFFQTLAEMPDFNLTKLANVIGSTSLTESYGMFSAAPGFEESHDDKILYQRLIDKVFSVLNVEYNAGVAVDRLTMITARADKYGPAIQELAQNARLLILEQIEATINANSTCWDGQALFSASHSWGKSGTQTNIVSGTGTTAAQILADYRSAKLLLRELKNSAGRVIRRPLFKPFLLVPSDIEGVMEELQSSELISSSTNVLKGKFEYMVLEGLTSADDWYMIDTSKAVKAFIVQELEAITLTTINPDLRHGSGMEGFQVGGAEADSKDYKFFGRWSGKVAPGQWLNIAMIDN